MLALRPGRRTRARSGAAVAGGAGRGAALALGPAGLLVACLLTVMFHRAGKAAGLTYRLHAVSVGGRWTWILGERFLAAVAHGQCLDGSPLRPSA